MKKSKTGFLIGRFQPFHKGHLYLLKESLKAVDELVIGIGSPDGGSQAENPFSFARRKKMLEIVIHEKHLSQRVQKITPVYDYLESDDQWYEEAKKAGGSFTVIIGNNEWTNGIFEKQGYPVIRFPFFKRFLYEGVKIRRLMREGKNWQSRVPESIVGVIKTDYRHAVLGGTFDHFHKGHVRLLSEAFQQANKVSIGVTAASMNSQKKLAGTIEPYDLRFKSVQAFLRSKNWQERAAVFPITDIFGPTKTDPSLDAIVVSPDTRQSALTINDFRKKNGRSVLEIISVPLEKGTDGQVITSERIRTGEINREGQAYLDFFVNTLMMPESLREVLRRPLGELKPGVEFAEEETIKEVIAGLKKKRPVMTLAVGDIVSLSSQRAGFESDTKIIDFRSRRLDISESYHRLLTAKKSDEVIAILKAENKAGTITVKAAAAIRQAVRLFLQKKRRSTIVVKGEEDLLTLPAILLAPLGAVVYYGQYDRGVVVVAVTEAVKRKVTGLIRAFSC